MPNVQVVVTEEERAALTKLLRAARENWFYDTARQQGLNPDDLRTAVLMVGIVESRMEGTLRGGDPDRDRLVERVWPAPKADL